MKWEWITLQNLWKFNGLSSVPIGFRGKNDTLNTHINLKKKQEFFKGKKLTPNFCLFWLFQGKNAHYNYSSEKEEKLYLWIELMALVTESEILEAIKHDLNNL